MKPLIPLLPALLLLGALPLAAAEPRLPRVQEPHIPSRSVSITDFGAIPDGRTLNTEAIARAIAALAHQGGGRVLIPPGYWLTGPIELKSNIELHLETGAFVQFSADESLFPLHENPNDPKKQVATSPLSGEHLENIAITGGGIFDGNGQAWRPVKHSKQTEGQWKQLLASGGVNPNNGDTWWPSAMATNNWRPHLLRIVGCKKVLLEGVTFQNSASWNVNPRLCEDVTIRGIKILNEWYAQNGDALDLEYCRNVVIRDAQVSAGDDAICLKSGANEAGRRMGVPTENVLIENCTIYHGHGGVVIGSEMSSGVRHVRVDNCTFVGTDAGLRFKSTRGRGGVVEDVSLRNLRMFNIAEDAITFDMYYGKKAAKTNGDDATATSDVTPPQFRDISIQNLVCRGAHRAIVLQGLPEMPIRGIHLSDVSITAVGGAACTDARDITFDNVEILNQTGPVLTLTGSRDVHINRLGWSPEAEAVFQLSGEKNAGITVRNTDLKAAKQDVRLSGGATREVLKVE
jgi:polygalacturonase